MDFLYIEKRGIIRISMQGNSNNLIHNQLSTIMTICQSLSQELFQSLKNQALIMRDLNSIKHQAISAINTNGVSLEDIEKARTKMDEEACNKDSSKTNFELDVEFEEKPNYLINQSYSAGKPTQTMSLENSFFLEELVSNTSGDVGDSNSEESLQNRKKSSPQLFVKRRRMFR